MCQLRSALAGPLPLMLVLSFATFFPFRLDKLGRFYVPFSPVLVDKLGHLEFAYTAPRIFVVDAV